MVEVKYQGEKVLINNTEDLLTNLLDKGHDIPFSCRKGTCQTCLMKATAGTPPPSAQKGLKDTLIAQNYFLACQCYTEAVQSDVLNIELPDTHETQFESHILKIDKLNHNVVQLSLAMPAGFEYRAGQYVTLWKDEHLARSYSIASATANSAANATIKNTDNDKLIFHIRLIPKGKFSGWLTKEAKAGDKLNIQGPMGDCFYMPDQTETDLVLIGTGTGLAPLYGILQDALQSNHNGKLQLFHGALNAADLYLIEELEQLCLQHENFQYIPTLVNADPNETSQKNRLIGDITEVVFKEIPSMQAKKVYLCGDPALVKKLKTKVFLAGANSGDIYADAFEPSEN